MPVFLAELVPFLGEAAAALWNLLKVVGVGAFAWTIFNTRPSDVGPGSNPTAAQQAAGAAGAAAQAAGQGAAATGSLAKTLGDNPAVLLIGGVAILLIALRR